MRMRGGIHGRVGGMGARYGRLLVTVGLMSAVGACGTTASPEGAGARGSENLSERCEVRPPLSGTLEPELQWAWTGSPVLPEHHQVMMTPVVVDVNGDHIPDIVFSTFAGANYSSDGVLRAVSGDDGHELWSVTDLSARVKPAASLAAGDIDGDGKVEVCGIPENGRGILCFENDGTFKFRSAEDAYDYNEWGGPSLADLDGDGSVEILDGNRVYDHTGSLKWVGSDGMGGAEYTGPVSFAADIDQDGTQEVVNDRAIYRHDGTLKCANTEIPHGFAGVANFDGDAAGEVVVSGYGKVSLLDDDCSLRWSVDVPSGGHGGPPNIADFDGDGQLEIGLPGEWAYSVLEADGSVKWSLPIQDQSSGRTGSTTFDFNADGRLEVVFADELKLRILDGATGSVLWEIPNSSGTTHENPIIADVDGDNAAELVVVSNDHAYAGSHGVRVFHDRNEGWAGTRRIWNQHAYSVTNINNDGTLPAHPAAHWLDARLNTFHANVANHFGDGPSPYAVADLVVSEPSATCDGEGTLVLRANVRNQGDAAVAAGLKVAFYAVDAASGGTLLGVATVPEPLPVGGSFLATVSVSSPLSGSAGLIASVDDDGSGVGRDTECREDNNTATATVDLSCEAPPSNEPPVALCRDVTVTADASCRGYASVDHGSYDPDHGPSPLSLSQSPDASFGLGRHAVTLTASDGEASAQCVGTVTVVDTTPPSITCPLSVDARVGLGNIGLNIQFAVSSKDSCGPAPVTCSHPSGSLFLLGLTQVTCTAKDGSGNTASCDFGIRVSLDLSL
ncbi:FG-GAP-like repeat-containing protein [Vitiosangium sp. GDMCC 1.1324]|uniref:FG-GAP-like repeat-containing protein n=1 Tax=Vitiosangium sp. (strain GDMCC 1.1324) TaxID=2138576 RepID=UPI000D3C9730|nr:FG-GAP-like repeat-containing protein [Vitiosangium sp. GDMCC 1.1324]PTL84178.1 hemolysin [Vitiosangium sp. GDMCC 1.1324]